MARLTSGLQSDNKVIDTVFVIWYNSIIKEVIQ